MPNRENCMFLDMLVVTKESGPSKRDTLPKKSKRYQKTLPKSGKCYQKGRGRYQKKLPKTQRMLPKTWKALPKRDCKRKNETVNATVSAKNETVKLKEIEKVIYEAMLESKKR